MATGRIAIIRDRGFGFTTRDGAPAPRDLFFRGAGVEAVGFDRLQVGRRAIHVASMASEQER